MERLSLDQFKSISQEENQENLELLTGGVLGACHVKDGGLEPWQETVKAIIKTFYPWPE